MLKSSMQVPLSVLQGIHPPPHVGASAEEQAEDSELDSSEDDSSDEDSSEEDSSEELDDAYVQSSVLYVQPNSPGGVQAMVPASQPRLMQSKTPRSAPSQASGTSAISFPQYGAEDDSSEEDTEDSEHSAGRGEPEAVTVIVSGYPVQIPKSNTRGTKVFVPLQLNEDPRSEVENS